VLVRRVWLASELGDPVCEYIETWVEFMYAPSITTLSSCLSDSPIFCIHYYFKNIVRSYKSIQSVTKKGTVLLCPPTFSHASIQYNIETFTFDRGYLILMKNNCFSNRLSLKYQRWLCIHYWMTQHLCQTLSKTQTNEQTNGQMPGIKFGAFQP